MNSRHEEKSAELSGQVVSEGVEFDEANGIYRARFDFSSRPLSEAVIYAVAEVAGSDPVELLPLYSVIDPDALDSLFAPTVAGSSRGDGSITFDIDDHRVTIQSDGIVEVELPDADERQ